jgi:hypothetical protein
MTTEFKKGEHLKKIFDICTWKNKHLHQLPETDHDIRYKWTEDEHEFARPFFSTGVLCEDSAATHRELYLGEDENGWVLCVTETTSKDFSPEEVAREMVRLMDPDTSMDALKGIYSTKSD